MPYGQSPKFQLVQFDAPATAVKPAEQGKPVSQGTETLVVNISQFLAKFRRVLAVPASVNKVIITVTAADGTVFTEVLDLVALAAGQTSVTFNGLVPGETTILIEAYNASNQVIGSSTDKAMVSPGVVAQKDVSLPVGPPPSAGGSGGSGGGGSTSAPQPSAPASPGGVTTTVNVIDGPIQGAAAPWTLVPHVRARIAMGSGTGSYWAVESEDDLFLPVRLKKVTTSGQVIQTLEPPDMTEVRRFAIDHDDHFWLATPSYVYRVTPTGHRQFELETHIARGTLTAPLIVDDTNHVWLPYHDRLLKVSPTGQIVKTVPLATPLDALTRDPQSGVLWGAPAFSNRLFSITPDGTLSELSVPAARSWNTIVMDVDAGGNLWVSCRETEAVFQVAPDGSALQRFVVPGVRGAFVDKAGMPWVFDATGASRLESTGKLGSGIAVRGVTHGVVKTLNGAVWLVRQNDFVPVIP